MIAPKITLLFSALHALLMIVLVYRVVAYRRGAKIGLGDGGDTRLLRRMRVHANFIEYVPMALLLIAGGFLSFLPVLGVWMLPLGLLLLAVDLPVLRGPISVLIIRSRRIAKRWLRRWQAWRKRRT